MAKFKGLIKRCEFCSNEFRVPQCQAHVRTCSTECGYKIRRSANKVEWVEVACATCGKSEKLPPSLAAGFKHCSTKCRDSNKERLARISARFTGSGNPMWKGGVGVLSVSSTGKTYVRSLPHVEGERSVRRSRAKSAATPSWANIEKMTAIYEESRRISEMTGIQHHVDHAVPLTSKLVCGLHNEFNLQIIPALENLRKHNRHWPDMP